MLTSGDREFCTLRQLDSNRELRYVSVRNPQSVSTRLRSGHYGEAVLASNKYYVPTPEHIYDSPRSSFLTRKAALFN